MFVPYKSRNLVRKVKVKQVGCVMVVYLMKCIRAIGKLNHKWKFVIPIGMRPMGDKTRHKIGQLSCRNVAKILPRN